MRVRRVSLLGGDSLRSRVLWAALLLAALVAALAAATCVQHEQSSDPAHRVAPAATTEAGSEIDATRNRRGGSAAVTRRPRVRIAPSAEDESTPSLLEERWFNEPVAQWETEKRIELTAEPPGVLVAKWIAMSDSGVELERRSGDKTLWRVHVAPLEIEHSAYHQEVTVVVDGSRVVVESVGAQKIVEVRDLATGAKTSREVTDVVR